MCADLFIPPERYEINNKNKSFASLKCIKLKFPIMNRFHTKLKLEAFEPPINSVTFQPAD